MPLASTLRESHGLANGDGHVHIVSTAKYVWSRAAMHAPFVVPAMVGVVLLLLRAASRDRLAWSLATMVIVVPVTIGFLAWDAHTAPTSVGQLCLVAMPTKAFRLLDVAGSHVMQDVSGRVPRYPVVASIDGIAIGPPRRDGGVFATPVRLRTLDVSIELECTAQGRLAGLSLLRHDERVALAVKGRLRLKKP